MNTNKKVEALLRGETIISREPGNSMTPILKSRQPVKLAALRIFEAGEWSYYGFPYPEKDGSDKNWHKAKELIGDIVYCKVRGNYYTHLVKAYNPKRGFLIGNNHGHNNGWTWKIYGKVTRIYRDEQQVREEQSEHA